MKVDSPIDCPPGTLLPVKICETNCDVTAHSGLTMAGRLIIDTASTCIDEVKQYYKQNLAHEGPIANFCSYSSFYFGTTTARLCEEQKPKTEEEFRHISEKYPDVVFYCSRVALDDAAFQLEKKFESVPLLGTRKPFSRNNHRGDIYIYRKLPDTQVPLKTH